MQEDFRSVPFYMLIVYMLSVAKLVVERPKYIVLALHVDNVESSLLFQQIAQL